MKKQLMAAVAVLLSFSGYAQTKGTNTLGLGFSSSTNKTEYIQQSTSDNKYSNSSISLGYGFFVEDNSRIAIDLSYGKSKNEYTAAPASASESKTYSAALSYQKYFPLVGKFYAYAGGKGSYGRYNQKQTSEATGNDEISRVDGDQFGLGAFGGLSWFFSKRWALETQLLSAGANYASYKQKENDQNGLSNKQTNFNLNSGGFFKDTSFKIYFLF